MGGASAARRNPRSSLRSARRFCRRRCPAHAAQRLGLGGDAGDGGVGEGGDEAGIAATEPAGGHLTLEEGDGAGGQRVDEHAQPVGLRGRQTAQLAHESEHRRAPHGDPERRPDDRVHAGQRLVGRRPHGSVDDDAQLAGRRCQDGVDQLVLAGEPVQDRLLADTDGGGDLVEGDAIDAAAAEEIERRGEDALAGRPDASRALSTIW